MEQIDNAIEQIHEAYPEHDIVHIDTEEVGKVIWNYLNSPESKKQMEDFTKHVVWRKPRGWRESIDIDNWNSGKWTDESTDTCG